MIRGYYYSLQDFHADLMVKVSMKSVLAVAAALREMKLNFQIDFLSRNYEQVKKSKLTWVHIINLDSLVFCAEQKCRFNSHQYDSCV